MLAAKPDRREELQRLGSESPSEWRWNLQLAQLEVEEENWNEVINRATWVLDRAPGNAEALLARGIAWASLQNREAAIRDLTASERAAESELSARLLLEAFLLEGRVGEAAAFLDRVPASIRALPAISQMSSHIDENREHPLITANGSSSSAPGSGGDTARDRAQVRLLLDKKLQVPELREVYRLAASVAESQPQSEQAQHLAGEAAYRLSKWNEAIAYFRRSLPNEAHPTLAFYLAVSLFEVGETAEAAAVLEPALPNLRRAPFVERYITKILRDGASR